MFNDFVSATAAVIDAVAATAFVSRYVIILIITFLLRLGPGTHFRTPVTDFHCKRTDKTLYLFTYAHLFSSTSLSIFPSHCLFLTRLLARLPEKRVTSCKMTIANLNVVTAVRDRHTHTHTHSHSITFFNPMLCFFLSTTH